MKACFKVLLLIYPTIVFCTNLVTIYDSGDTASIKPYYGSIEQQESEIGVDKDNKLGSAISFPITTANMSPGIMQPIDKHIPHFQIPLFIIGNDVYSKQWLVSRRDELIRLQAVGMLVEAKNVTELDVIRQLATGLKIYPASGNDLAEQLNLTHYPVLISRFGIEQ